LLPEEAGQQSHALREVFNGLRSIVKTGARWRLMPHDLPPWAAVYQQAQRWLAAGCFEALADDLRAILRLANGRNPEPSAAMFDSRTRPCLSRRHTEFQFDRKEAGAKIIILQQKWPHAFPVAPRDVRPLASGKVQAIAQECEWTVPYARGCHSASPIGSDSISMMFSDGLVVSPKEIAPCIEVAGLPP
jgi:transposase